MRTAMQCPIPPTKTLKSWFQGVVLLCCAIAMVWGWSLSPALAAAVQRSHAPETARAYVIAPVDGDTVESDFTVKFGLSGMGIAPAGIDQDGTGHHHLLIDLAELPDLTQPLPATAQIKHFGGGQTEANISLPPGEHSLRLVLANASHVPHDNPVVSEPVTITVR